jgi:hypothetical protein
MNGPEQGGVKFFLNRGGGQVGRWWIEQTIAIPLASLAMTHHTVLLEQPLSFGGTAFGSPQAASLDCPNEYEEDKQRTSQRIHVLFHFADRP